MSDIQKSEDDETIEFTEQDKEELFNNLKDILKIIGIPDEEIEACQTLEELAVLVEKAQENMSEENEPSPEDLELDQLMEKMELEQSISENEINLTMESFMGNSEIVSLLDQNPLSILKVENINKIEEYVNKLKATISETKEKTFEEVRKSQLPQQYKEQMLKEMRKNIAPIEEELKNMEKLLEELKKTSEAINNAKIIDA